MSHSHGKKRRRYQLINGHKFMAGRRGVGDEARGERSLCGLTMAEAAHTTGFQCQPCDVAAKTLWA